MSLWLALACSSQAADPGMKMAEVPKPGPNQAAAVFAGGCFWCMESDFDHMPGVVSTTSGFAGGKEPNPTYEQVSSHLTSHLESVYVIYDTTKTTYDQVLDYYWHHVDPTDDGGQFCDRGDSYRTAIFPQDDTQKSAAEGSKAKLDASRVLSGPVVTRILPGQKFWPAEVYHQDFHDKDPGRYLPYRQGCGRDARVAEVWKNAPTR